MVGLGHDAGPHPGGGARGRHLRRRWRRLIEAPAEEKAALFQEHRRDRTVTKIVGGEPLGDLPLDPTPIGEARGDAPGPMRYGFRSFDRQWMLPDKRLINRPNPSLWSVRSDRQIFLTALHTVPIRSGPAATFTGLIPDLDHYKGGFGGRAYPLWRDAAGTRPNLLPGLRALLGRRHGDRPEPDPVDPVVYLAALLAQPAFTARLADDLELPGLRVPLTAGGALFHEAVEVGRQVLWLHTHGERVADAAAGRPAGPPRVPEPERPRVTRPIPDDPAGMPEALGYAPADRALLVGSGRIEPVPPAVSAYQVSGVNVLRKWFGHRKREPEGRRASALDQIVPERWHPTLTTELLDLLNVLGLPSALHPRQADLLARVMDAPLVSVAELTDAGVLPVPEEARRAPAVSRRDRAGSLRLDDER